MGGGGSKSKNKVADNAANIEPAKGNQVAPAESQQGKSGAAASVVAAGAGGKTDGGPRKIAVAPPAEAFLNVNKARLKQSRTVRVFISSTFRDFALERDYLMRHALPELRKFGESRGVTVVFVDLRWGVTSEESSGGAVVKLCLQEIDACRPFFVGMLGERYGWHLDPSREDDLLSTTMDIGENIYPWVAEYRNRSVTELEMLHGALKEPHLAEFVTFYFREHEAFKKNMASQIPAADLAAFEAESEHAKRGQDRLKDEIRKTFRENSHDYNTVKQLSEQLVQDISRAIDAEFPMDGSFDEWDGIDLQHEAFAATRRMGYVAQPGVFDKLNSYVNGNGSSVAVTGISGLGKSAVLANWAAAYVKDHEERKKGLFTHFIGCTSESTDHYNIIRRIMAHYSKTLGMDILDFVDKDTASKLARPGDTESQNPILYLKEDQLIEIFPDFMAMVSSKAKDSNINIVIVLDGLDQLEDKGNAHSLFWLPDTPGIHFMCAIKYVAEAAKKKASMAPTMTPREQQAVDEDRNCRVALKCWKQRGWDTVALSDLVAEQQERVIVGYLAEHAKKLDEKQIAMVLTAKPASNPLFLRTLLDEARLFGNFFMLTDHLAMLLQAETNPDLFGRVCKRMGEECGQNMMQWAVGLILCVRDGITDQELREVLMMKQDSDGQKEYYAGTKLSSFTLEGDTAMRHFIQLLFGLREQLCSMSGFMRFFHDAVKDAVNGIVGEGSQHEASHILLHRRLAQYFGSVDRNEDIVHSDEKAARRARQMREYPYHLAQSQQFDQLAAYLSRVDVLETMLLDESKKYEMIGYWRQIGIAWNKDGNSAQSPVEKYLDKVAQDAKIGINTALHELSGDKAKAMRERMLVASKTMDLVSTLLVLLSLYDCAVSIRQDEISYNTILHGAVHDKISISCSELADVYEKVYCKYDVSMKLKSRAVDIDRQLYGEENRQLAVGYDNLALLQLKLGNYKEAEELYLKSLAIKEKLLGKTHRDIAQTVCSLGLLHEELGNLDEAEKWYLRSLHVRTKSFGPAHPSVARSQIDLGMLALKRGQKVREVALSYVQQGYDNLTSALGFSHTDVAAAANNLGLVFSQLGDYDIALDWHLRAKKIQLSKLGEDHPAYAATCTNIGSVSQELADRAFRKNNTDLEFENFNIAEDHYSRAILIYRVKMGDQHHELATTLHNLGTLCFDTVQREVARVQDCIADLETAEKKGSDANEIKEETTAIKQKIQELLEQAKSNFEDALSIRVHVFGKGNPSTLSSQEALDTVVEKLNRMIETNGEDVGQDAEPEDDLELYVNDMGKLVALVEEMFQLAFESKDKTIQLDGEDLTLILDHLAEALSIEVPTPKDVQKALKTLQIPQDGTVDAKKTGTIVQTILKQVYM